MSATIRGIKSNKGNISKVHFKIGYRDVNLSESFFFNLNSEVWLFISSMVIISYNSMIYFNIQLLELSEGNKTVDNVSIRKFLNESHELQSLVAKSKLIGKLIFDCPR